MSRTRRRRNPSNLKKPINERVLRKAFENGLSLYPRGYWDQGKGVMVGPPFIVTKQQVDEIVEILERSLDEAERDVIS